MAKIKFWNADKIVSFSAFFISLGTFSIYLYQTHLIQKQQFASALPYLEIWNSYPNNSEYRLMLVNNGIGPAFIEEIKIIYKNKAYSYDPVTFYKEEYLKQNKRDTIRFISSNVFKGMVIPANGKLNMIEILNSEKYVNRAQNLFGNETAKVEIIYKSVYDEKWRVSGMGNPPEKQK
ncbi:MAG: hypothetical protein H7Y04_16075 [Verrucomicrobia bacterium]|nr:hypothetical protein [Cytophagales bacterium]